MLNLQKVQKTKMQELTVSLLLIAHYDSQKIKHNLHEIKFKQVFPFILPSSSFGNSKCKEMLPCLSRDIEDVYYFIAMAINVNVDRKIFSTKLFI